MRPLFFNFLVLLLALATSLHSVNTLALDFTIEGQNTLKSLPHWEIEAIHSPTGKNQSKLNLLAEQFSLLNIFPIQHYYSIQPNHYYLPLFNLTREENYFLLI